MGDQQHTGEVCVPYLFWKPPSIVWQQRAPSSRQGVLGADALIDNLTVFEMLLYTAELKLDMRMNFLDKCKKVQRVIEQLALNTCRDVRIGSALTRGISGAYLPLKFILIPDWKSVGIRAHLENVAVGLPLGPCSLSCIFCAHILIYQCQACLGFWR